MKDRVMVPLLRLVRQPAFLVCAGLLAMSAIGLRVAADKLEFYLRKEPVPLQKPLEEMDKAKLWPYKFVHANKIDDLAVEESLGAQDYMQWVLEDTRVEERDPTRFVNLFVTYYTGDPDAVPHVPDWCYSGMGGQILDSNNTTIQVPERNENGAQRREIPVRELYMLITDKYGSYRKPVVYFFSVNGDYRCTRDTVRLRVNSIFDRHAYFSKVEIDFGRAEITPDKALAGAEKLMQVVLPVLEAEHWPDWAAVKAAEKRGEAYLPAAKQN